MTGPLVVFDEGDFGVISHPFHEALTSSRDGEVDVFVLLNKPFKGLSLCGGDNLNNIRRDILFFTGLAKNFCQDPIGVNGLGSSSKDDNITGLETEACGINGHVGTGLINHEDHSQWNACLLDVKSVGAVP